jgi:predicted dehydrogenase
MTNPTLCGVLYGHGHMGQLHAAKLAARPDVLLSVVDPLQGLNPAINTPPDFAIVATPTTMHANIAAPLLAQGIPCLVEKPLALGLQEATMLATHPHLSVGHIERFNPVFRVLENICAEYIEIERLTPFSKRSTDVDVIDDLMIHDLDLLARFMPGELIDVRAKGVGVMTDKPEVVNARLEFKQSGGRIGVVNLTASRVSASPVRTWRLVEPSQYWSLDLLKRSAKTVSWADASMSTVEIDVPTIDPLTAEHTAFLNAVRGSAPFPCTGREALVALKLADRIRTCLH